MIFPSCYKKRWWGHWKSLRIDEEYWEKARDLHGNGASARRARMTSSLSTAAVRTATSRSLSLDPLKTRQSRNTVSWALEARGIRNLEWRKIMREDEAEPLLSLSSNLSAMCRVCLEPHPASPATRSTLDDRHDRVQARTILWEGRSTIYKLRWGCAWTWCAQSRCCVESHCPPKPWYNTPSVRSRLQCCMRYPAWLAVIEKRWRWVNSELYLISWDLYWLNQCFIPPPMLYKPS